MTLRIQYEPVLCNDDKNISLVKNDDVEQMSTGETQLDERTM
jgi:hypothetical protein